MSGSIMTMMIGISPFLGALALAAHIWGIKTGQFDDQSKFIDGARFDNEDELQDAIQMEEKKKRAKEKAKEEKAKKEKNYRPAD
jgi:cbb3-type cytochrome oxidase maturation protein